MKIVKKYKFASIVSIIENPIWKIAVLVLLTVPLSVTFGIYMIIVNILTCALSLYSFQKIFKSFRYAYLTTVLYMLAIYRLTNGYVRAAVGEYTAMAFLSLVLYGFYKVYYINHKNSYWDTLPLIIGVTGILQTHMLTVEMMVVYVGIFCVVHIRKTLQNIVPLLQAFVSIVLINMFFLIPFIDCYQNALWINSGNMKSSVAATAAYVYQIFGLFVKTTGLNQEYSAYNEFSLSIGASLTIGVLLYFLLMIYHKRIFVSEEKQRSYKQSLECFGFGMLAILFSSVFFPWADLSDCNNPIINIFTSLQFAWRYLSYATLFLSVVTVFAIKSFAEWKEISIKQMARS